MSGLAAFAVWSVGQPTLGLAIAVLTLVYHTPVYATGGRLLKPRSQPTQSRVEASAVEATGEG